MYARDLRHRDAAASQAPLFAIPLFRRYVRLCTMTPKLSILTPVRNDCESIGACIESVQHQDCGDYEHIILDAMSSDGTSEIIADRAKADSRIIHIRERDAGQSDALNKGIRRAVAPIISSLSADDSFAPEIFAFVVATFSTLPELSILVGDCDVVGEKGELQWRASPTTLDVVRMVAHPSFVHPVNTASYFWHASIHRRFGIYFDVGNHMSMDLEFVWSALRVCHTKKAERVFCRYARVPGTKTYESARSGTAVAERNRIRRKFLRQFNTEEKMRCLYWCAKATYWQMSRHRGARTSL